MRPAGKYQLTSLIASGGMAEVWRAEVAGPAGVRKEAAVKLVRGGHDAGGEFARMLVEEARLAMRLTHANVVQVFELVEEGGRHAIAMELVRGRDLGRVLERCRERGVRLGLPRAVHLGVEVARGLAYAHRLAEGGRPLGIVHRDVSPHNVLVSFEGEVKLADFGIARATQLREQTRAGVRKGTYAYMSPEQVSGRPLTVASDQFSLATLLIELCTGQRPFDAGSPLETMDRIREAAPPSMNGVPVELVPVLLRALSREPVDRYASSRELRAALLATGPVADELALSALVPREVSAAAGPATRIDSSS